MGKDRAYIPDPPFARFLFASPTLSWLWLLLRVYVGWQWLLAGYEKAISPVWVGPKAGIGLSRFLHTSLIKTAGAHPDVSGWYGYFLQHVVLQNVGWFSYVVVYGELLVGVALMLGIFTGVAAFFGAFMNMNYLFAGTVSINPLLFLFELFLILAWRVAGWYGLDRWLLLLLGTPWKPGKIFKK